MAAGGAAAARLPRGLRLEGVRLGRRRGPWRLLGALGGSGGLAAAVALWYLGVYDVVLRLASRQEGFCTRGPSWTSAPQRSAAYIRNGISLKAVGDQGTATPAGEPPPELARRAAALAGGAAALAAAGAAADSALRAADERYALAGTVLPPAPYKETLRTELVPGLIWGFEQVIAFSTVSANIRMTAVRLADGGLWVSSPVSPTRQCLRLLDELGDVAHLVVPGTALEHKASLAEFARAYPRASVWVSPVQNASPFDPPLGTRVAGILGEGPRPPWADEIDYKVFFVGPPDTAGTYAETAFFHAQSRTLLVSDAVLKVPASPPPVLASYGYEGQPAEVSPEQWHYKFLAFNFLALRGSNDADFEALARPKAIVSPLLRFTLYPICEAQARAWVESVAQWPFERAVAAHLESPFPLQPPEFLEAFGFLFGRRSSYEPQGAQLANLRSLSEQLTGPQALRSSIWQAV